MTLFTKTDRQVKILIIRFSSLGDIFQALPTVAALRARFPEGQIHWLVRSDFARLLQAYDGIDRVWSLPPYEGVMGLLKLLWKMRQENFTHIYDAHSNLRSSIARLILAPWHRRLVGLQFARRHKHRIKRALLFRLRYNLFPQPFVGAKSYVTPLKRWGLDPNAIHPAGPFQNPPLGPILRELAPFLSHSVVLAPSAAWPLKRWPLEYWEQLIREQSQRTFVVVGGPKDQFCQKLQSVDPSRVHNLAGQLTWEQTLWLIKNAQQVVSGDTGVLHMADFLGVPTVALIGPTAFGYPHRPTSHVMEISGLPCRPCSKDGRGRCRNSEYQKCLRDISPRAVSSALLNLDHTSI